MKKTLQLTSIALLAANYSFSQCTPVSCLATLPAYGGICDTVLLTGTVNIPYSDSKSFHITTACFDAGIISPANAGTAIVITTLKTFTYASLPVGITGASNLATYTSPANGCVAFTGPPTEIGTFRPAINFLADINAYPLGGGTCTGFAVPQANNASSYKVNLIILPVASFTGLQATYCITDAPSTLTVTGTTGGTFTGAGVSGTTFNPSLAGPGTHVIKYIVSRQEGAAIAPAADSSSYTVNVYAPGVYYQDFDGDGYGNVAVRQYSCVPSVGYVADSSDCNDADASIHPHAVDIPNDGIDQDCWGGDSLLTSVAALQAGNISLFPNPGTNELFISFTNNISESVLIRLMSIDGKEIIEELVPTAKKDSKIKLNTANLAEGLYFVKLRSNNYETCYRWVKTK